MKQMFKDGKLTIGFDSQDEADANDILKNIKSKKFITLTPTEKNKLLKYLIKKDGIDIDLS